MVGLASLFYFLGLRSLPVSVAAATANSYIVITVLLSTFVLHQPMTKTRGGSNRAYPRWSDGPRRWGGLTNCAGPRFAHDSPGATLALSPLLSTTDQGRWTVGGVP
jgi:hypothetical protein